MPFKQGFAPIRRSVQYLNQSPIVFIDKVKVMTINYNVPQKYFTKKTEFPQHEGMDSSCWFPEFFLQFSFFQIPGTKDFVTWTLPQIQYKNPNVQITTFLNQTPSPFITCYLNDGQKVFFDVDGHSKEDITERLNNVLGKSKEQLAKEAEAEAEKDNPANFGRNSQRYCICAEPGQVPCPSFIPLPKKWRGKYRKGQAEEDEED